MYIDVRKIVGILDTPLPQVRISHNLSVLFVRIIRKLLNPPPYVRTSYVHGPLSQLDFFPISKGDMSGTKSGGDFSEQKAAAATRTSSSLSLQLMRGMSSTHSLESLTESKRLLESELI